MIWDENTHLMADLEAVASQTGTSLVREEAFKLTRDKPLFGLEDIEFTAGEKALWLQHNLVIREGNKFRMWYLVYGLNVPDLAGENLGKNPITAYAESDDGIHFHPVVLDQYKFKGSTKNSFLSFPQGDESQVRVFNIFHDPLDKEYPFKSVYYRPGKGEDFDRTLLARHPERALKDWWYIWGIGKSRDGLVWEAPTHKHNLLACNPEHAQLHRAMNGGLVISDQMFSPIGSWSYRNVRGWIAYDDEGLEIAHPLPEYVFGMPEHVCRNFAEFGSSEWDRTPWIQPHVGLRCARKGSCIIALSGYLYGATGAETYSQVTDVGLVTSSTGTFFREVWPYRPFIPRGTRGDWDFGMVVQAAIVDTDEKTFLYYTGGDRGNFSSGYAPGLAYIERDRYAYRLIKGMRKYEASPMEAEFTLKPLRLPEHPKLDINVSHCGQGRRIQLELADPANGNALPGFSYSDCQPVQTDGLNVPVSFTGDFTTLADRQVTVRVKLASASCGQVRFDSPRIYAIYTG